MLKRLEDLISRLAYRRACRALQRARGTWFLRELLRRRLDARLITPAEVIAIVRTWKTPRA